MKNNILDLEYEALLQPTSALRVHKPNNLTISAAQFKAAGIKFFGLEQLFQFNQKTK